MVQVQQNKCLSLQAISRQNHHHHEHKFKLGARHFRSSRPTGLKLRLIELFAVVSLVPLVWHNNNVQLGAALIQVPNRHTVASIPGDLVLGILVPVHERPSPKQAQTRTCGAVREQYGIQRVEAAFRTIDSINADPNILPNITLGIEIRDSCWHSPIALEQSIEFIRDAMAASEQPPLPPPGQQPSAVGATRSLRLNNASSGTQSLATAPTLGQQNLEHNQHQLAGSASGSASTASTTATAAHVSSSVAATCALYLKQQQQTKKIKNLVGVVGPASSGDTVQVQNLLQLFNMPQVGYSATSRDLSNKNFFKYFLRVVPSDKLQAQVLIDLMLAHNWTYITVVYTEGSYGSSLMNAFRERAQEVGICFATLESMPPNADDGKFDELIEAIQNHRNARVVICMCEGRTIGRLFAGFKRQNISNEFLIVGSDGWSDRFDVVEQQEEIALGGISIRIHSAYVHDFDDYYFGLNPFTNHRNPWFAEFWEQRFQCNLEYPMQHQQQQQQQQQQHQHRPAFIRPANARVYNRTCTGKESLRQNHKQDAKMAFVQKSIITMALGLDSMQRAICGPNKPGLCAEMLPVNGSVFLQHLMDVRFSFLGEEVYFDEQGDPPGKYEILNFQRKQKLLTDEERLQSARDPPRGDSKFGKIDYGETGPNQDNLYDQSSYGEFRDDESGYTSTKLSLNKQQKQPQQQQQRKQQQQQVINSSASIGKHSSSYATLHVHNKNRTIELDRFNSSPSAARAGPVSESNLISRIDKRQAPPSSDYSSTSDYEYVHVGSWKSSDGLSLFGTIHWPIRSSTTFQRHHYQHNQRNQQQQHTGGGASPPGQWPIGDGAGGSSTTQVSPNQQGSGGTNGSTALSEWSLDPTSGAGPGTGAGGGVGNYEQRYESDDDVPVPKSVCSLPCAKGHAKKIQSDSVKCCWVCVPCRPREYLFTEFKCKACDKGWWPNADQTGCDQIPIEYLDWRSLEALVSIAIALFGLVLTLLTALVFIKHNDTPVVKSTTRELSYMILFSMVLCYINTFFLVTKPNKQACFVTRILPGFSFAMMYGALVTKTNRIARILAGSKKKIITRRPCFMSATAQVTITWLIVLIECAIIVIGLVKEPADMTLEYPSDERVALVCNTTTMAIIAPLGFDFFLIAMCTVYAFKTRNVPENFNEAKFIGFTMYTTLVIWIAFVVIYLSSDHKVTTLCLCISFSALFALFLLFFPRCYIILFKPEKNNRSYFTTIKNVRCHIGYQIPGGSGTGGSGHGGQSGSTTSAGIASANNSLIGQLNASTNNQIKFKGARGGVLNAAHLQRPSSSLTSSPTTKKSATASIIGNHFAYSAKGLLLSAPDETASSRQQQHHHHHHNQHKRPGQLQLSDSLRDRTSGGRVAPAATRLSPEDQKLWEAGKLTESDVRQRLRADSDEVTDCAQGATSRPPNGSGPRGPIGNNDAGADAELDANENGTAADVARDGSDRVQRGPLHFVFGAVRSIQSAFARRSRRKESDKTAVIQQHLRAIRHAENLDRQTHFRRSQVQRLVQRFDSNTLSSDQQVMLMNGQHLNGQLESDETTDASRLAMQQFCEFLGDQQNCDLVKFVHSGEAIHLLAGMSQLLGHDNVCRLASVLSRYCDQNRSQIVTPIGEGSRTSGLTDQVVDFVGAPLNLRRPADRRMALAWLRFLVQMSHKAIESVQTIISTLPKHLTSPLLPATSAGDELLLSARALELASKQEIGCIMSDSSPQGEAGDKKGEPACQCGNLQLNGGDGNAKETNGRRQVKSADYATHNLSRPRRVSDTVSTQQDNNGLVLARVSCCQSKAADDKLSTTTRVKPSDRSMPARAVNMATSANMSRQPPSSTAGDKWTGNELDNNEPMGRSGNLNRLDQKRIGANGASDVNESEMLQASAVKHKYDSARRAPSDDSDDPIRLVLERISAPGQRQQAVGRDGSSHMGDDKRCCRREEGRAKTPPANHSKARRPHHDTLDDDRDQETCLHLNERGQLELLSSSSSPTHLADSGKQNGGDWRAADCSQLEGHEGQAKNKEESQRCCRANGTRVVPHIGASGELVAINGQVRAASAGSGRSDQTSSSALERSTSGNCGPPPSEHHVDSSLCRSRCRTQVRHCPACATGRHLCKTGATCRSCSRLHRARANTTPTPPTCDLNNGLEAARTLMGQSPSACKLNGQVAPQQHQEQQQLQEAQVKANRTCCFRRCCRRCSCCSCTIQDSRCRSRSREANQQEQEQHNGKGKDKDKERLPQHAHHHHHHHRHIHSYKTGQGLGLDEPASKMKHSTSCSSAMVRIASRPINLSAIEINVKRKEEEDNNLVVMTPKRLQEVAVTSATTASSLSASSRPLLSSKVDEHRPPGAANSIAGAYQQRPAGGHDV